MVTTTPPRCPAKSVLVCYGRTRSYLDPVRYLTSDSSGRMGRALVTAFRTAGWRVSQVVAGTAPSVSSPPLMSNLAVLNAIKKNCRGLSALFVWLILLILPGHPVLTIR